MTFIDININNIVNNNANINKLETELFIIIVI
jgi:hypothetical protein